MVQKLNEQFSIGSVPTDNKNTVLITFDVLHWTLTFSHPNYTDAFGGAATYVVNLDRWKDFGGTGVLSLYRANEVSKDVVGAMNLSESTFSRLVLIKEIRLVCAMPDARSVKISVEGNAVTELRAAAFIGFNGLVQERDQG